MCVRLLNYHENNSGLQLNRKFYFIVSYMLVVDQNGNKLKKIDFSGHPISLSCVTLINIMIFFCFFEINIKVPFAFQYCLKH